MLVWGGAYEVGYTASTRGFLSLPARRRLQTKTYRCRCPKVARTSMSQLKETSCGRFTERIRNDYHWLSAHNCQYKCPRSGMPHLQAKKPLQVRSYGSSLELDDTKPMPLVKRGYASEEESGSRRIWKIWGLADCSTMRINGTKTRKQALSELHQLPIFSITTFGR